jgi:hypothetical protein
MGNWFPKAIVVENVVDFSGPMFSAVTEIIFSPGVSQEKETVSDSPPVLNSGVCPVACHL